MSWEACGHSSHPATSDADPASTSASEVEGGGWREVEDVLIALWQCETEVGLWFNAAKVRTKFDARMAAAETRGRAEALREAADEWPGQQVARRPIGQWLRDRADSLAAPRGDGEST